MVAVDEYQIRDLAFGEGHWRIDWFGAVTYAERYRRNSQPLIEVQLSKLPDDLQSLDELPSLKNDQWPKTRQVRLPVGFLSLLKIGDVWRDGRFVESPQYEQESFNTLHVHRNNTTLIKAGLSEDEGKSFYLPISHHPYHFRHTHSYCVLVKSEAANIVIPSVELIRFYFGSSSNLLSRIFDLPFAEEKFWLDIQPGTKSNTPKIHLAPGISGRSASDVGRIAFSKSARSAVELIGNSCIAATINGESAYPKAIFPFEGHTNLVASGKWLPFRGNEHGVFLVFKLISCSHPFPFSGLRYTSERSGQVSSLAKFSDSNSTQVDAKRENRFFKSLQEDKTIVDTEPSKARTSRGLGLLFEKQIKFPDLTRKAVSKTDIDQVPTILHSLSGTSIISGSSVGEGGKDREVQPIDLVGADQIPATLSRNAPSAKTLTSAIFLQLTSMLLSSSRYVSIDIVRLDPRQRFDYLSTMPLIVDDDGEVESSCLVPAKIDKDSDLVSTRHRKISIGRALELYACHYFMIPESMSMTEGVPQEIELHLITDRSKSIANNMDLQAAIAAHFSQNSDSPKTIELGIGIESVRFNVLEQDNLFEGASEIAEKLYQRICAVTQSAVIGAPASL